MLSGLKLKERVDWFMIDRHFLLYFGLLKSILKLLKVKEILENEHSISVKNYQVG